MLRISFQTLRSRRGTLAGAFVAIRLAVTLDAAAARRQPLGVAREGEHDHPEHERGDPGGKEGEPHFERPSFTREPAAGKRRAQVPRPPSPPG